VEMRMMMLMMMTVKGKVTFSEFDKF
jgi:hypothetical protein